MSGPICAPTLRLTMTSIIDERDRHTGTANVVIVAAHDTLRTGLAALLAVEPDIKVKGTGADLDAVAAAARQGRLDVAIVDNRIAGISSPSARAALDVLAASLPVIVMGAGDRNRYESAAIAAGAVGYWPKYDDPDSLVKDIRAAAGRRSMRAGAHRRSGYRAGSPDSSDRAPTERSARREWPGAQISESVRRASNAP